MSLILLQSTQIAIPVGPFGDATDGFTPEEALTLSATRANLYKPVSVVPTALEARTWSHVEKGIYSLTLTTGDTDTPGSAIISFAIAAARPLLVPLLILPASIKNALLTGTQFPADVTKINGSATAAANLGLSGLAIVGLTVSTSSTTTVVTTHLTASVNNFYVGRTLVFPSGAQAGQATTITAYNGTTKALTVGALTSAPASSDTAVIV